MIKAGSRVIDVFEVADRYKIKNERPQRLFVETGLVCFDNSLLVIMPMRNLNTDRAVASHYGSSELTDRILKALGASKAKPPTLAALAQIDQLHHGRLGLTERLVSVAKIERGMHVLDAGSGIGGAARHLASVCGCRVDAIDLTPEFVNTGAELDKLVGLSDSISYRLGSVTDLPYESSSFDVVWSQNVTMNVADKSSMFSEAMRVLRPGGVFAFTHLAQNSEEEVDFPMPWANSKDTSFLGNPVEILATLGQIGFENAVDHTSAFMPLPPPPSDGPDNSVVMGGNMGVRSSNSMAALADGRLIPMMVTARRPD